MRHDALAAAGCVAILSGLCSAGCAILAASDDPVIIMKRGPHRTYPWISPDVSPDGRRVVCCVPEGHGEDDVFERADIAVIDVATGKRTTLRFQPGLKFDVRWLNDERIVFRCVGPDRMIHLYMAALDGSPVRRLTDRELGDIDDYLPSPNGKVIAMMFSRPDRSRAGCGFLEVASGRITNLGDTRWLRPMMLEGFPDDESFCLSGAAGGPLVGRGSWGIIVCDASTGAVKAETYHYASGPYQEMYRLRRFGKAQENYQPEFLYENARGGRKLESAWDLWKYDAGSPEEEKSARRPILATLGGRYASNRYVARTSDLVAQIRWPEVINPETDWDGAWIELLDFKTRTARRLCPLIEKAM